MSAPTTIFSDVGGVLLTNGWDREARMSLAETFGLDWNKFSERHRLVEGRFETGGLTLDQYLDQTVFDCERKFARATVREFIFARSKPLPESLALLRRIRKHSKLLLATLNNESTDLNLYRIEKFDLRSYFDLFFSSCFLGVSKPDEAIYRRALDITQRKPGECIFIDDCGMNVEAAKRCGLHAIQFTSVAQLEAELRALGVIL